MSLEILILLGKDLTKRQREFALTEYAIWRFLPLRRFAKLLAWRAFAINFSEFSMDKVFKVSLNVRFVFFIFFPLTFSKCIWKMKSGNGR